MDQHIAIEPPALDIPGTWNARDVGGRAVPTGGTRPLATGVLLRTASLSKVSDAGLRALRDLDVTTVCDLRSPQEVSRDGADRVPEGTRVVYRSMSPGAQSDEDGAASADPAVMIARLRGSDDPVRAARQVMEGVYRTFVLDPRIRAQVGLALGDIAASEGASVVHCSAGKDRTGWTVALVQYLCGVDEAGRMAEYVASAAGVDSLAAAIPDVPGVSREALMPLLTVEEEYLDTAWRLAVEEFGSIDAYLSDCGVVDEVRGRLRERLVG